MLPIIYLIAIPAIPLLCFVVLGLFGRKYFNRAAGAIATMAMAISAFIAMVAGYQYFFVVGTTDGVYRQIIPFSFTWLDFGGGLSIDLGMVLDPISVMMIVVVTLVSLMVHIFSLWYMKGEERYATYYAFLGLFSFSMLGLVLASNLFQVYIFWELVGVSSFLLIGYYYEKASAVAAAKKAFIVTRFADFGFLIGILILSFYSQTLDIAAMISKLTAPAFLGLSAITIALVLVFAGGAGKSAMFPLHIWLPDAMEGPTPVSALIHAATMVVAGVYLVARLFPLYSMDPTALAIIRYTGIISACLAAIIACTQTDIKRILAFSTMSQIGYMMFALGLSPATDTPGYTASMFHLFTHAFFKSLLFLCAGAIIHYVQSNDLREMGGLKKQLPLTHACFLVACLAIAGIPPFAGFFSKEEILFAAFQSNPSIYWLALLTGGLTAFYMFRLYFSVFWNKSSEIQHQRPHQDQTGQPAIHNHQHHHSEGNFFMKLPLVFLAICSAVVGLLPFANWVTASGEPHSTELHLGFSVLPVILAIVGISLAASLYKTENDRPARLAGNFGAFYQAAVKKFYIDEIYLFITKNILFNLVGRAAAWFDRHIVDGAMNQLAAITASVSGQTKAWQSGKVQSYAIYFFGGILTLALLFIYLWQ